MATQQWPCGKGQTLPKDGCLTAAMMSVPQADGCDQYVDDGGSFSWFLHDFSEDARASLILMVYLCLTTSVENSSVCECTDAVRST